MSRFEVNCSPPPSISKLTPASITIILTKVNNTFRVTLVTPPLLTHRHKADPSQKSDVIYGRIPKGLLLNLYRDASFISMRCIMQTPERGNFHPLFRYCKMIVVFVCFFFCHCKLFDYIQSLHTTWLDFGVYNFV